MTVLTVMTAVTVATAQAVPIRPGEVVERVSSPSASGQSYAVYLPKSYSADRTWPVLFLMDPRGRALVPLELLRPAAERFGYLILSSYNTASDAAVDPNVDAMNAMITDALKSLAVNNRRFYLVGFSGTAREGWSFGYQLSRNVAGLIGVGAGLPPGILLPDIASSDSAPFDFYGGAGVTDFNYEEVLGLDDYLVQQEDPASHPLLPGRPRLGATGGDDRGRRVAGASSDEARSRRSAGLMARLPLPASPGYGRLARPGWRVLCSLAGT